MSVVWSSNYYAQSLIVLENHESTRVEFEDFKYFFKVKCKTWKCMFLKISFFLFTIRNCSDMVKSQARNLKIV